MVGLDETGFTADDTCADVVDEASAMVATVATAPVTDAVTAATIAIRRHPVEDQRLMDLDMGFPSLRRRTAPIAEFHRSAEPR
jgi:hypothetical protein